MHGVTGRVLGIVSRGYRLVSNRQALEWTFQCCRTVFPETDSSEWAVKAIDAPSTAGHCCLDLVHNSTILDFSLVSPEGRPDVFGPFIRVTNSHNGLRALVFNIGFFRAAEGEFQYVIRSAYEDHQRVAKENELSRNCAGKRLMIW